MELSNNGLSFIRSHEGLSLTWYELKDNGLTVGYGHYVPHAAAKSMGIKKGDKISMNQAVEYLKADMQRFVNGTNTQLKNFGFTVNQNQFDALVSYAFNRGIGNAAGTNGLRQLLKNSKTVEQIGDNMPIYWGTNTHYKKGLISRRNAERKLFKTPVNENVPKNEQAIKTFSSATLHEMYKERLNSYHTMQLLDSQAVKLLGHTSKLKEGKLYEGDMVAIAIELAVYHTKEK